MFIGWFFAIHLSLCSVSSHWLFYEIALCKTLSPLLYVLLIQICLSVLIPSPKIGALARVKILWFKQQNDYDD